MKKLPLLLATSSLAALSVGGFISAEAPVYVFAEEEGVSSVESFSDPEGSSNAEGSSVGSEEQTQTPSEEKKDAFNIETFLDRVFAIIGGFSAGNILAAILSVVMMVAKSKSDNAVKTKINEQQKIIDDSDKKVAELVVAVKALIEVVASLSAKTEQKFGEFAELSKTIDERLSEQNLHIVKVENMKDVNDALVELVVKTISLSDVAVKSGIAEEAKALIAKLQGDEPDGEQAD